MKSQDILALPMGVNDARARTVAQYLNALLINLWTEGEGFSGKRPFGNSGWKVELYYALVKGGAVKGVFDEEWDDLFDIDTKAADEIIEKAINSLFDS